MKNRGKLQKEVAFNLELWNSKNVEKCAFQVVVPSSAKRWFSQRIVQRLPHHSLHEEASKS